MIGIVAGRLAEKYHRPVVLISWDKFGMKPGIGSARSVPGFNLHAALAACEEHLVGHGGHAAAAGLRIEEDKLERFRADFCEHVAAEIDRRPAGRRIGDRRRGPPERVHACRRFARWSNWPRSVKATPGRWCAPAA